MFCFWRTWCHELFPHLCGGFLFLILCPAPRRPPPPPPPSPPPPCHTRTQFCHTHNLSHTTLSQTQLCPTPSFTHTLVTHNFVTHHLSHTTLSHTQLCHTHTTLSHTTLSHTIFHTQLYHTHTHNFVTHTHTIFHTSFTHNCVTHTHTQLCHAHTHTIFHTSFTHNFATHNFATHNFATQSFTPTLSHTHTHNFGTWRHRCSICVAGVALADIDLSFCEAGVALGDIHLHFAWQAWRLAICTQHLRGRRGAYDTGLAARLGAVGRCGATWRHGRSICVTGVALMALGWLWWLAWAPLVGPGHAIFHIQLCHTHTHSSHTTLSHTTLHTQLLELSIFHHLLCPFWFFRAASTTFSDHWKRLTCGVIRSFIIWMAQQKLKVHATSVGFCVRPRQSWALESTAIKRFWMWWTRPWTSR